MSGATLQMGQAPHAPHSRRVMSGNKVDTEFLASSHFTIAQDHTINPRRQKSVFQHDYVPWEMDSKPLSAKPPKLAEVLQKDERYFNEKASETKQAYEYRQLSKPELKDASGKLGATNFKMDSDPRLNCFQTTHNSDYTPKGAAAYLRNAPQKNAMRSFIPQGDQEKAPEPLSDYRDRYRGHDVGAAKPDRVMPLQGGPTIIGDHRQHHFATTHNDTYVGLTLPKVPSCEVPYGSSIPQGDKDKEVTMQTVHQSSFPRHDLIGAGYDKNAVMGKLQGTNFKQGDGSGKWNDYLSTMMESYTPTQAEIYRKEPGFHRNHSDFPAGDYDPSRNTFRANMTTNRFYHGNIPPTKRPNVVSGADKRTASQVCFGEPTLGDQYYETTTDSTFRPVQLPDKDKRPHFNTKSVVPLDYYAGEDNNKTSYRNDFLNPRQGKTIPNPEAIDNLKQSHIRAPLGGLRQFSTEHLDQYTPKEAGRHNVDPGRLQRSNVPLGTLKA